MREGGQVSAPAWSRAWPYAYGLLLVSLFPIVMSIILSGEGALAAPAFLLALSPWLIVGILLLVGKRMGVVLPAILLALGAVWAFLAASSWGGTMLWAYFALWIAALIGLCFLPVQDSFMRRTLQSGMAPQKPSAGARRLVQVMAVLLGLLGVWIIVYTILNFDLAVSTGVVLVFGLIMIALGLVIIALAVEAWRFKRRHYVATFFWLGIVPIIAPFLSSSYYWTRGEIVSYSLFSLFSVIGMYSFTFSKSVKFLFEVGDGT